MDNSTSHQEFKLDSNGLFLDDGPVPIGLREQLETDYRSGARTALELFTAGRDPDTPYFTALAEMRRSKSERRHFATGYNEMLEEIEAAPNNIDLAAWLAAVRRWASRKSVSKWLNTTIDWPYWEEFDCDSTMPMPGRVPIPRPSIIAASEEEDEEEEEEDEGQPAAADAAGLVWIDDLESEDPQLHDPIIDGLLRCGETMNVIAPSKTGKSWLTLSLAMAVATGRPWLGAFNTRPGPVLLLDNELHLGTINYRRKRVQDAYAIATADIRGKFAVRSLRGELTDIAGLRSLFGTIDPGTFSLVILDALYRFIPAGVSESDNGAIAQIYNWLDQYAAQLGAAFVCVHHSTKGSQAGKDVVDVGSGAGSQARAADVHAILRAHEEKDAFVLEATARSWPPITPRAMRWKFPVWEPAPDLDPALLKRPKNGKNGEPAVTDEAARTFVDGTFKALPLTREQIITALRARHYTVRAAHAMLATCEQMGLLHRWPRSQSDPLRYGTVPPLT